jgi:cytochrome c-type biogenesis protein CcmH/NrfG
MQGKHTEAVRTGQALVQAVPTSRSWYLAAKSLTTLGQMDGADQACRTGLKQNPTDVHCILGIAAIMMRRSDDATTLRDAKTLLDLARRECRPDSGAALLAEIEYLTAIHQALSGESAIARVKLQRMQTDTPGNQRYAKALAAFTP